MTPPILLAVPNVSEGRDVRAIGELAAAFVPETSAPAQAQAPVRLLDVHSDRDHHRSVFTLAGRQRALADALLHGARAAVESIDIVARAGGDRALAGTHPHVGAIDVVPLVYLDAAARGAACAAALVVGERIGHELGVPVFLYGELAGELPGRTRAELRRGGIAGLVARMTPAGGAQDALRPDFGPAKPHASAGATLVAAREPLVAFNLQLQAPATVADARRIAELIREGGEHGLPGLRAIGVQLRGGVAQVSMNVERPLELSLAEVVQAVARHAPLSSAELVGLAPRAALERFPDDLPMLGFDPARHLIENALATDSAPDPDTAISDQSKQGKSGGQERPP
jgi:glutamate formiminotransferase/glutamate formiminotransferase/formiminotetrahydrofolate cyclodeaminase